MSILIPVRCFILLCGADDIFCPIILSTKEKKKLLAAKYKYYYFNVNTTKKNNLWIVMLAMIIEISKSIYKCINILCYAYCYILICTHFVYLLVMFLGHIWMMVIELRLNDFRFSAKKLEKKKRNPI